MASVSAAQNRQLQSGPAGDLRIRLLGPLGVSLDGVSVELASKRARSLLGYLVLHEGREVARRVLTGLLWGERSEDQARASLRQTLSELRRALSGSGTDAIRANKEAVAWNPGSARVDASALEAAGSTE